MRANQIKPGMILAWRPRYHTKVIKVEVIAPGATEGYRHSFQGVGPEKGWKVKILDDTKIGSGQKSMLDTNGNPVALGRHLIGTWDDYQADRKAAQKEAAQRARERRVQEEAFGRARFDLQRLAAQGMGGKEFQRKLLFDTISFDPIELLELITEVQRLTLHQAASDLVDYRDSRPARGQSDGYWRRGVEAAATHIRPKTVTNEENA